MRSFIDILMVVACLGLCFACAEERPKTTPDRGTPDISVGMDASTACDPACPSGFTCCGVACVDTSQSLNNCGGCGIACTSDQRCTNGICTTVQTDCVPACDDARSSTCDTTANPPSCKCGQNAQCPPGQVCARGAVLRCVDLNTDTDNCGDLGNVCGEGETCLSGMCSCGSPGNRCGAGEACCGGTCSDTTSDPMNCGGCGMACGEEGLSCENSMCSCGGQVCTAPTMGAPGQSCCMGEDGTLGCVDNTNENCACMGMCENGDECTASAGLGGGDLAVCCGNELTILLGCAGFPVP